MIIIHIARKPLSESSVSDNVTRHGTGAINIDKCRIGIKTELHSSSPRKFRQGFQKGFVSGTETQQKSHGRWPANVILTHHPECVRVGERKVKGTQDGGFKDIPSRNWKNTSAAGIRRVGYADSDGTETMEAWDCHPDCPVRKLDEQSGSLSSGMMKPGQRRKASRGKGGYQDHFPDEATSTGTYGDKGGASRFFKQIQDELE